MPGRRDPHPRIEGSVSAIRWVAARRAGQATGMAAKASGDVTCCFDREVRRVPHLPGIPREVGEVEQHANRPQVGAAPRPDRSEVEQTLHVRPVFVASQRSSEGALLAGGERLPSTLCTRTHWKAEPVRRRRPTRWSDIRRPPDGAHEDHPADAGEARRLEDRIAAVVLKGIMRPEKSCSFSSTPARCTIATTPRLARRKTAAFGMSARTRSGNAALLTRPCVPNVRTEWSDQESDVDAHRHFSVRGDDLIGQSVPR